MEHRVLVNENTSPRVAESLRGKGITAKHVHEALSKGVDDDTITTFARENGSVVLTHDPDFLDPYDRRWLTCSR
jgi:predicted nuclease of predicted toxin-antitoxin system